MGQTVHTARNIPQFLIAITRTKTKIRMQLTTLSKEEVEVRERMGKGKVIKRVPILLLTIRPMYRGKMCRLHREKTEIHPTQIRREGKEQKKQHQQHQQKAKPKQNLDHYLLLLLLFLLLHNLHLLRHQNRPMCRIQRIPINQQHRAGRQEYNQRISSSHNHRRVKKQPRQATVRQSHKRQPHQMPRRTHQQGVTLSQHPHPQPARLLPAARVKTPQRRGLPTAPRRLLPRLRTTTMPTPPTRPPARGILRRQACRLPFP
ncbi:hypothetical protein MOQ_006797, partial [Trypanosoma cruzi marinkellei]